MTCKLYYILVVVPMSAAKVGNQNWVSNLRSSVRSFVLQRSVKKFSGEAASSEKKNESVLVYKAMAAIVAGRV